MIDDGGVIETSSSKSKEGLIGEENNETRAQLTKTAQMK